MVILMDIGIYDIDKASALDYKERLKIYKDVGFVELGIYFDEKYINKEENYLAILNYARSIGLRVNQVHLDYGISNLICSKETDEYFDYLEKKINEAISNNISIIVLHASKGDTPPIIDNDNLMKLDNLLAKYEDKNIFVCFENVRNNNNLDLVLSLNRKNIGMCYDLGHAHCYDDEYTLLEKYKNKIICSHLHNNAGKDSHNLLSEGEINYVEIIKKLRKTPVKSACLEVFPPRGSFLTKEQFIEFIIKCYKDINL